MTTDELLTTIAADGVPYPAAMRKLADEAACSYGHHEADTRLDGHRGETGHWWTFDFDGIYAFARALLAASPAAPAQSVEPVESTCRYEVKYTPVAGEAFWAEVSFKEYEDSRLNGSPVRRVTPPCQGMNCGCTDGANHSLECHAEHVAAIAGGTFVKAPSAVALDDAPTQGN